jgi:hypothetical protein
VRLAPGDFSAVVPGLGPIPFDVDLGVDSARDVDLAGATTLTTHLPTAPSVPGISAGPLDVSLQPGATDVRVRVTTALAVDLPGVPIHLDLAGSGFELPFSLGGAPRWASTRVPWRRWRRAAPALSCRCRSSRAPVACSAPATASTRGCSPSSCRRCRWTPTVCSGCGRSHSS